MEKVTKKQKESSLLTFFVQELQDMHAAEKYIGMALPRIHNASASDELRSVILDHIADTETHAVRLENIFILLGISGKPNKCEAMEGLFKEVAKIIDETEPGTSTRDAALIIVAQKVAHYEIATYGGLVQLATTLGHERVTLQLERTLQDEKDTDILYSDLAEKKVNWLAETEMSVQVDRS